MKTEYTYKDLTKPSNRENMRKLGVTTLGTKSGGFGPFQPQFKVVSEESVKNIAYELVSFCVENNVNFHAVNAACPTLKELLK